MIPFHAPDEGNLLPVGRPTWHKCAHRWKGQLQSLATRAIATPQRAIGERSLGNPLPVPAMNLYPSAEIPERYGANSPDCGAYLTSSARGKLPIAENFTDLGYRLPAKSSSDPP